MLYRNIAFYSELFVFSVLKRNNLKKFMYFCNVHTHASGRNGWNGDILESVIDALFLAI